MNAKIENGNLVVEIPIDLLNSSLENHPNVPLRITNEKKMVEWFQNICLDAYENAEAWLEGLVSVEEAEE